MEVFIPYIFKIDKDVVIGGYTTPPLRTPITEKDVRRLIKRDCMNQPVCFDERNLEILLGIRDGCFEPSSYCSHYHTQRIGRVLSCTDSGLWLQLPDPMVSVIKEKNIKITFRWMIKMAVEDNIKTTTLHAISELNFVYIESGEMIIL